jgi:DNA-binding transcriptional MerR regulator
MSTYLTSGQVAKKLRVSLSTLKRWVGESEIEIDERRNYNGWRLFSEHDVALLRSYKKKIKRNGKRFNETTLIPIVVNGSGALAQHQRS